MLVVTNLLLMVMDIKQLFFIENREYVTISGLELTNQASHKNSNGSVKLMNQSSRSGLNERYGLLVLRSGSNNVKNISLSDLK